MDDYWRLLQGGTYDATQFKNKCISKKPTYQNLRPSGKMGEDCLYLNIWTPKAVRGFLTRFPLHGSLLPASRALPPHQPGLPHLTAVCVCVRRVQATKLNASLPVYVFVHGGGLREGSGSFTFYDGAAFAASNNVVVVTINYRLGPFGFLVPPAPTGRGRGPVDVHPSFPRPLQTLRDPPSAAIARLGRFMPG